MSLNNVGEYIKKARIEKNITQEELAEMIDITPTHIKHIESGHRKPSVPVLFSLAEILDMSIDNAIFNSFSGKEKLIHDIDIGLRRLDTNELMVVKDLVNSIEKNKL